MKKLDNIEKEEKHKGSMEKNDLILTFVFIVDPLNDMIIIIINNNIYIIRNIQYYEL